MKNILCKYGCNQEAIYKLKNGALSCSKHFSQCPEQRKRNAKSHIGNILSVEHRRKLSEARKGPKHHAYGKTFSEEHKKKMSEAQKGKKSHMYGKKGKKHPMYGKKLSDERKREISKAMKGRKGPMAGRFHSEESRIKASCTHQGINRKDWTCFVGPEPYCGVWYDKEFKDSIKKIRDGKCQEPTCWHTTDDFSLTVHHIDYDKKNCHPDNLITLCHSCNGRANADREWHTAWYKAIMLRQGKLLRKDIAA